MPCSLCTTGEPGRSSLRSRKMASGSIASRCWRRRRCATRSPNSCASVTSIGASGPRASPRSIGATARANALAAVHEVPPAVELRRLRAAGSRGGFRGVPRIRRRAGPGRDDPPGGGRSRALKFQLTRVAVELGRGQRWRGHVHRRDPCAGAARVRGNASCPNTASSTGVNSSAGAQQRPAGVDAEVLVAPRRFPQKRCAAPW
jgi:hypothetical protein